MQELVLREYETQDKIALDAQQVKLLLNLRKPLNLEITPAWGGLYTLKANACVGVVQSANFRLQIKPKIPVTNLFFLLAYASGLTLWPNFQAEYQASEDIYEILALCFARSVSQLLRQGILQGYRTEAEALNMLRGRIDFALQIREYFGRIPPIQCEYQLFTEDIPENQILAATLRVLNQVRFRSSQLNQQLAQQARQLGGVSLLQRPLLTLSQMQWTRLNQRYAPALSLARQILQHAGFSENLGEVKASSFIVDMNRAFEDFVVIALREALQLDAKSFPQNATGRYLYLDEHRDIHLKPDLSWWQGRDCLFIGDVKYKRTQQGLAKREDIYQLLAYLDATQLNWGLLIYAETSAKPHVYTLKSGKSIDAVALDLLATPQEILTQIQAVADLIREKVGRP
ncbi:MAG: McrC family protein [Candidatus Sericytochromatia bacterium]